VRPGKPLDNRLPDFAPAARGEKPCGGLHPPDEPGAGRRAWTNHPLAFVRALVLVAASAGLFAAYCARVAFLAETERRRIVPRWMQCWARVLCRVLGYRVIQRGSLPPPGSLVVPNHISYADVFPLMACHPCFFVPKAEVARWLFVGMLVRGTQMIFATRRLGTRDLIGTAAAIEERLRGGFPVCVFLEGTTTSGDRILPFRTAFVQPAVDCGARVVPVAVRWRATRPGTSVVEDVAFWKDHIFFPHFWRHIGLGGFEVEIIFGAPVPSANQDRKVLAAQVRDKLVELWRI